MAKHGKRFRATVEKVDPQRLYPTDEGIRVVKETATAKFDETVELHVRTGLDPRHADQVVRASAALPSGSGRTQRVLVFADGDAAREAEAAGADIVGLDDILERVQGGWLDFDVAVATREAMGKVGRVARILGPRGLMPNPRSGTVTDDVGRAVKEIKGGRVEFRVDKTGVIHVPIGKASFTEDQLQANLGALLDAVVRAKPTGAKGQYIRRLTLAATMGPGVDLEVQGTLELASSAS